MARTKSITSSANYRLKPNSSKSKPKRNVKVKVEANIEEDTRPVALPPERVPTLPNSFIFQLGAKWPTESSGPTEYHASRSYIDGNSNEVYVVTFKSHDHVLGTAYDVNYVNERLAAGDWVMTSQHSNGVELPEEGQKFGTVDPKSAEDFLQFAEMDIHGQASKRDKESTGERSMLNAVLAFNAMFGKDLTEVQGWQFMELLKMSRSASGAIHANDYQDGAAYAALAGEAAVRGLARPQATETR